MIRKVVFNILLTNVADSDAEELIAGFRHAGEIIQFERIQKAEELEAALKSQAWDLLIYTEIDNAADGQITVQQCGDALRKKDAITPIFYVGEANPLDSPDPAISQIFANFNTSALIHDALKERAFRQLQHDLLQSQALLSDAERRNQLLLSESSDAIAYITDGMIVHTNEQFCELLGITDIEGVSVLDLVVENDISRLKTALKQSALNEREYPLDLNFSDDGEGEALHYKVVLSSAIFEEEPCIQLRIDSAANGTDNPLADIASSSIQNFNRVLHEFLETERNTDSSLLIIGIDEFNVLRAQHGINNTEDFAVVLAAQIKSSLPGSHFGRLADDVFAVIAHKMGSDEALANCREFVAKIAQHSFEVHQKSIHCTVSAVALPINHLTPHDTSLLIEIGFHNLQQLMDLGGNQAELYRRDHQHLSKEGDIGNIVDEAIGNKRVHLLFEPLMALGSSGENHYEVAPHMKNATADEVSG
ncbi:MAG: diguanylate cyclase domain-containing protein, partial [Spongiibacteraceae bacterium]